MILYRNKRLTGLITRATLMLALMQYSCFDPVPHTTDLKCEHLSAAIAVDNPSPRLSWKISGPTSSQAGYVYTVLVSSDSMQLANGNADMWRYEVLNPDKFLVRYTGNKLRPLTKYYWKVDCRSHTGRKMPSSISSFETGMMDMLNWQGSWITSSGRRRHYHDFRKDFTPTRSVTSARIYISADAPYTVSMNGNSVNGPVTSLQQLPPGSYKTFDVTSEITSGVNVVGITLAPSYSAGSEANAKFIANLRLTYDNGSIEIISTDHTWTTNANAYSQTNSGRTVEFHASEITTGWGISAFDDRGWANAQTSFPVSDTLISHLYSPQISALAVEPDKMWNNDNQCYRFHWNKPVSGFVRLNLNSGDSTRFEMVYLNELDSLISCQTLLASQSKDSVLTAERDIIYSAYTDTEFNSLFNYRQFQYIQILSDTAVTLSISDIEGITFENKASRTGNIRSSSEAISRIYQKSLESFDSYLTRIIANSNRGIRAINNESITSHIDPFSFDIFPFIESELMSVYNNSSLYRPSRYSGNFALADNIFTMPYLYYLFTADQYLCEKFYDGLKSRMDNLTASATNGLISARDYSRQGTASAIADEYTASAYLFNDVTIASATASILGRTNEAAMYSTIAEKIYNAVNAKYFNRETSQYGSGSIEDLAIALFFKIVPEELVPRVAARLNMQIEEANFLSFNNDIRITLFALSDNGYANSAYHIISQLALLENNTRPITNSSTMSVSPASQSELSLGEHTYLQIGEWLFCGPGGIRPDAEIPGFRLIELIPTFMDAVDDFEAEYHSTYGVVISKWSRKGNKIVYECTIPTGCSARLILPRSSSTADKERILASGHHKVKFTLN